MDEGNAPSRRLDQPEISPAEQVPARAGRRVAVLPRFLPSLRRVNAVGASALALLTGGVVLDVVAATVHGAGILTSPGAIVIGAGVGLIVSTVTGEAQARRQYRKEAVLRYKDTLYLPLHTEVRAALHRLQAAPAGSAASPQRITIGDEAASPDLSPLPDATEVSLQHWAQFGSDSRAQFFSAHARNLLDAMLETALSYNAALDPLRQAVRDALAEQLTVAIDETRRSPDYQRWKEQQARQPPQPAGMQLEWHWYSLLDQPGLPRPLPDIWANGWINSAHLGQRQPTVGRLLSGRPDRAAELTYRAMTSPTNEPAIPADWLTRVFEGTWAELQKQGAYHAAVEARGALHASVRTAETYLSDRLRAIRDQYEGGEPLV